MLDPRHRNLLVLSQDIVPERAFYDKPMGFYDLDAFPDSAINVDGIDLQRAFSDDVFIKTPRNARNLLLSFR